MSTIFELKNRDFDLFDAQKAVEFMHELLCCEATKHDISLNKIHITKRITVPDGGIDAEVEEGLPKKEDIIKKGLSSYQIKTGSTFEPQNVKHIKKELFGRKAVKKDNLGHAVGNCLNKNGTYILVCFGCDPTPEQIRKSAIYLKHFFSECGYKETKVEVWGQSVLSGFIKDYPSIALKYQGLQSSYFQSHDSWGLNADMKKQLVKTEDYNSLIQDVQEVLINAIDPVHLRVIEVAGSGKTRFVFEATQDPRIKPLVIYSQKPEYIKNDLLPRLIREDNAFQAVIVLDECNAQQKMEIWNQLKSKSPRIRLITIFNEFEQKDYDIQYPKIPGLGKAEIKTIIQNYGIQPQQAERYAEFAGTSPRFAHMIGENLTLHPEDILKPVEDIYNRIVAGYDEPSSDKVEKRRRVLRYLALFRKFGYKAPHQEEADSISKKITGDCKISKAEFDEIIAKLKELKILQGETTLYITPLALHIRMWIEWWAIHGSSFQLDEFLKDIPKNSELRLWFFEMFKYAEQSQIANKVVVELLGDNGPFQKKSFIDSQIEARFFLALTEANPEAALKCLQKTIGHWNKEQLLKFTTGRREVVWALERIAIWEDLFADGARILLKLAEAENESYSNNATGIFVELFSSGYGKLAPTEASPQKRFPLLLEALDSESNEIKNIALSACDLALRTYGSTRMIGAEFQGLRKEPILWKPKTYGELFDYYRMVWNELSKRIEELDLEQKKLVVNIFLHNARGLTNVASLSDMVIDTFRNLSEKDYVDKKELLSAIIRFLHFDGKKLPQAIYNKWDSLKSQIAGEDYPSLMKRYVGMNLIEDEFDENGNRTDVSQKRIQELAYISIENINLFEKELSWLVSEEAKNGYTFGYELAEKDKDYSVLPLLLDSLARTNQKCSTFFIGGYFRSMSNKDIERWEKETTQISSNKELQRYYSEIVRRSTVTDKTALRVLQLVKEGIIPINELKNYAYGSILLHLSVDIFQQWIIFIINSKTNEAGTIAATLCNHYFLTDENKSKFDANLVYKVITHESFFKGFPPSLPDPMDDYYWTQLGKVLVQKHKKYGLKLAKKAFEYFGVKGSILSDTFSTTHEVFNVITKEYPVEIWDILTKYLGPPIDERAFRLYNWLRGGQFYKEPGGALYYIPFNTICEWVDADIENRAWYLAYFVPSVLFAGQGDKLCYAREVLAKYGNREDVLSNFTANYSTEGWYGPSSLHFTNKKKELLEFKKNEHDKNVIRWIDDYVSYLDKAIAKSKVDEERDSF